MPLLWTNFQPPCLSLRRSLEADALQLQLYIAPLAALFVIPFMPVLDNYSFSDPSSILHYDFTANAFVSCHDTHAEHIILSHPCPFLHSPVRLPYLSSIPVKFHHLVVALETLAMSLSTLTQFVPVLFSTCGRYDLMYRLQLL